MHVSLNAAIHALMQPFRHSSMNGCIHAYRSVCMNASFQTIRHRCILGFCIHNILICNNASLHSFVHAGMHAFVKSYKCHQELSMIPHFPRMCSAVSLRFCGPLAVYTIRQFLLFRSLFRFVEAHVSSQFFYFAEYIVWCGPNETRV